MHNKVIGRSSTCRLVLGSIFALACFAVCYLVSESLLKSCVLACAFLISGSIDIRIPQKLQNMVAMVALLITAAAALFLSQFAQNEGFASLKEGMLVRGYLCCLMITGFLFLVVADVRWCMISTTGITLILATLNWFVFRFRGSEFLPIDIMSTGTAMNVANQYDFTFTPNLVYAWVLFFLLAFGIFSFQFSEVRRRSRAYLCAVVAELAICLVFVLATQNVRAIHFGNGGTYYQGYMLNFVLSTKELVVKKPDGYSQDSVASIMEEYLTDSEASAAGKTPNVIVIMDEAYADLRVLGPNYCTSTAVSPFIEGLEENTVKGYAMSSAYGGRTANSEFEFLTGATLGFVPKGTVAYQQYVREDTISLAAVLKQRGYDTVAMHPYLRNGWTRETVWPYLGFEECYFLEDFPQKKLMRNFVSDLEMMEFVISRYEQQDASDPLFLFGVTMQNHSDYVYDGDDFQTYGFLKGYSQEYPAADQYLTLIHESDKAARFLIEYLSSSDRETVVVWFGDHLPALDASLYEQIRGGAFETLDDQICHYKVPFFIWANFEIPEKTVECTSLSFLSTYVFEAAGIELTPYQKFLSDVESAIPSINMEGYYSVEKGMYALIDEASGVEAEWLNRYQQIQYNYLFDDFEKAFFGIS